MMQIKILLKNSFMRLLTILQSLNLEKFASVSILVFLISWKKYNSVTLIHKYLQLRYFAHKYKVKKYCHSLKLVIKISI